MADVLDQHVSQVNVNDISPYPKNPRKGNVKLIADSLKENGQFRPLVVQKSTGFILGGNHTFYAAQELGWATVRVVYVDVDDEQAKRIVLADNRTSDLATYDAQILSEILSSLDRPSVGTGYSTSELKHLISAVEEQNIELVRDVINPMTDVVIGSEGRDELGSDAQIMHDVPDDYDDDGPLEIDEQPGFFPNQVLQLDPTIKFPIKNYWGIPEFREDMLMQEDEIPAKLAAWSGSATRDWPEEDQWWIYNYGIDSTSGMNDTSKCILSFYTHDHYFDPWWEDPASFVTKTLNSGIRYAIPPNWSLWSGEMTRAEMLWNVYRSHWMGRFFQECGLKIIPDIRFVSSDLKWTNENILSVYPDRIPVAATQFQTFDKDQPLEELREAADVVEHILALKDIGTWIFYASKRGEQFLHMIDWTKARNKNFKKLVIPHRLTKLAQRAEARAKANTL